MLNTLKAAQETRYWLLGLAASLMLFHLALTDQTGDMKSLSISFIFWGAIASMVWDKKESLQFRSTLFSSVLGTTILGLALFKTLQISSGGVFVQALPLIFAFSLALMASGWEYLGQYRKELLAFAILALPGERFLSGGLEALLTNTTGQNLTMLTAKTATFGLNLVGMNPLLTDDVYINLSRSIVRVHEGCSGAGIIDFLLRLALLFLIIFKTSQQGKWLSPLIAIALGFIINGVRVALMAFLINNFNTETFDYWHVGDGSQVFGAIGVILLGGICYRFIQPEPSHSPQSSEHGT